MPWQRREPHHQGFLEPFAEYPKDGQPKRTLPTERLEDEDVGWCLSSVAAQLDVDHLGCRTLQGWPPHIDMLKHPGNWHIRHATRICFGIAIDDAIMEDSGNAAVKLRPQL